MPLKKKKEEEEEEEEDDDDDDDDCCSFHMVYHEYINVTLPSLVLIYQVSNIIFPHHELQSI